MKTGRPRTPVKDRLLARREIRGECWIYTGSRTRDGYGVLGVGRANQVRAHRAAYEAFVGPIPAGMLVCHKCDTPLCFRPDHLFLGSQSVNRKDMFSKGRGPDHRGERHPSVKLTDAQVDELRARRAAGEKLTALAAEFNVSFQHVSALARGVFRANT